MPLIMAPGGSKAAVIAAIDNGGDGFYLGGRGWSRWGRITELSEDEVAECIAMGRRLGKEVQVVFNRVPAHGENADFLQAVESCCRQGASEVILNDLGTISLVRRHLPAVQVGTSIGCALKNLEDAKFYADLGVSTLVLPWKMGPGEIRALKEYAPGLRLEMFLYVEAPHVVLGNCWLGSYVHQKQAPGRSGTVRLSGSARRGGNCSQPCTSSWEFSAPGIPGTPGGVLTGGPLPHRRLVALASLQAMTLAGVDLLKIQGRNLDSEKIGKLVRTLKDFVTSTHKRYGAESPAGWDRTGWDPVRIENLMELLPQLEFV